MVRFEDENGHSHYWYDASDVAKHLKLERQDGKILGRNLFSEFLRFNGVLLKDSTQPKQSWIDMGLARYHMVNRRYRLYGMTLFSDKGIAFIERKVATGSFQIGFEKRKKTDSNIVNPEDVF